MLTRIVAVLLAVLLPAAALAQQPPQNWDRPVVCCDGRLGCQVLQMVMMGSFDTFDPDQPLSVRVLSAAYPKLKSVTNADMKHFMEEFSVEEAVLRQEYYIALASCLWADILMGPTEDEKEQEARQMLLVFLDPSSSVNAEQELALIRSSITDDVYAQLTSRLGLETDFIRYLIESENWREPAPVS